MEKKTLLAISLSLLILIGYNVILSKSVHKNQKFQPSTIQRREIEKTRTDAQELNTNNQTPGAKKEEIVEERKIGKYKITLSLSTGTIKKIELIEYGYDFLVEGFMGEEDGAQHTDYEAVTENKRLVIVGRIDGRKMLAKTFDFNDDYRVDVSVEVFNHGQEHKKFSFKIKKDLNGEEARYQEIFYKQDFSIRRVALASLKQPIAVTGYKYFGYRSRYFCVSLLPGEYTGNLQISKSGNGSISVVFDGSRESAAISFFLGPQKIDLLKKASLEEIVNFGVFNFFATVLLKGMQLFYRIIHSWALSIIFITIIINVLLFPLTKKSTESMKHIQSVQGEIEKLKSKHSNNPQKLNKETFELYKKYKINPLSGCLPWLLQIPVFIGFFQVITRMVEVKGEKFLWIKDLSLPDRLFKLPGGMPFSIEYINLLPVVMAALMFFQQKLTTQNTGAIQKDQQKIMTVILPVVMGVIFYNFSSALMLYWLTNSAVMFVCQYKMLKKA